MILTLSFENEYQRRSFEQLYEKYRMPMLGLALSILGSQSDAEDAVNNAFLAAAEAFDRLHDMAEPQLKAWLMTAVKYKAIDIYRERMHMDYVDEYPEDLRDAEPDADPQTELLYQAMKRLPPYNQDLLVLRLDQGFSTGEIAKMLGKNRAAVQKELWRTTQMLKKIVKEIQEEEN